MTETPRLLNTDDADAVLEDAAEHPERYRADWDGKEWYLKGLPETADERGFVPYIRSTKAMPDAVRTVMAQTEGGRATLEIMDRKVFPL